MPPADCERRAQDQLKFLRCVLARGFGWAAPLLQAREPPRVKDDHAILADAPAALPLLVVVVVVVLILLETVGVDFVVVLLQACVASLCSGEVVDEPVAKGCRTSAADLNARIMPW